MAKLLAFDTSTEAMSMALALPQGVLARDLPGGAQASAALIPGLLALLAEGGCSLGELDAIAFGCGPGAFTGLRTACAVAQGLAFGAGRPVVPVDSLLIVAQDARTQCAAADDLPVWVAMDARMDEIYAAAYRWHRGRWSVSTPPALLSVDGLNALWRASPPRLIAGSALDAFGARLRAPGARCLPALHARAAALAEVALQRWADGAAVEAQHALPVYLRDKVAQTTLEREAAALAKAAAGSAGAEAAR